MESTPAGRLGTVLSLRTRQADTTAECQCSNGRQHILRSRPSNSLGPNVVGFQLATGKRRWYIVEFYLAHDDTLTIESVVAALKERPRGAELVVAGDLTAKLLEPEGDRRGEDIAAAPATEYLEDMLAHLLPQWRSWCWNGRTWSMLWEGREVWS